MNVTSGSLEKRAENEVSMIDKLGTELAYGYFVNS